MPNEYQELASKRSKILIKGQILATKSFMFEDLQCLSKKLGFLAIYEVKWGGFTLK